ncbi:MAG: LysR family transcriptional regulator [Hyphomicrobiales bacterium]|nr:LysR family transcriptional regulator [Hyphomicrobiales bacterium]
MNLRQLEAFHEVMLTGSVTESARNLGRTQPAVSAQIRALEEGVGYKLFDRRGGRLHPVPEAHYLLSEARAILDRVDALERTMQDVGALEAGHLRIACMPVHAEFLVPHVISRFVRDRGDVTISMVSQSSRLVYERLASQQFDVGFAEVSARSPLVDERVFEVYCVCAVNAGDPLAKRPYLTPRDLDGKPAALFLPEHFVPRRLREMFAEAGCELRVRFETQNAASQYVFVEDALAYAVMSPFNVSIYRRNSPDPSRIVFVPLRPAVPYPIAILVPAHRPLSRLAQAFVAFLDREITALLAAEPAAAMGRAATAGEDLEGGAAAVRER